MRRGIFIIGIILLFLATGCTLEDALPDQGELCEGALYVVTPSRAECRRDDAGECVEVPHLSVAFERGRCPKGYLCDAVGRFCFPACAAGEVMCDGRCIDPVRDDDYCGASGSCLEGSAGQRCAGEQFCVNGVCVGSDCDTGYHLVDGVCVEDTAAACGRGAVDCTRLPGWREGDCVKGLCVAAVCQDRYCLNGGACVAGMNAPMTCGVGGGVCVDCTKNTDGMTACNAGSCWLNPCEAGVCYQGNGGCVNTNEACGSGCLDCREANHASAGHCMAGGNCFATACAEDHHFEGGVPGKCVPDTDDCCGGGCEDCSGSSIGPFCVKGACGCPVGQMLCGSSCVDPLTSDTNCGARGSCSSSTSSNSNYRGASCTGGRFCASGVCVCPEGEMLCGSSCIDPLTSDTNCGARGTCSSSTSSSSNYRGAGCTGGRFCADGVCVCSEGQVLCGSSCIDPLVNNANCGARGTCTGSGSTNNAGQNCGTAGTCVSGICTCPGEQVFCNGNCINPLTSNANCGATGNCSGSGSGNSQGTNCTTGNRICVNGTCECPGGQIVCGGSCINPSTSTSYCGASGDCTGAGAGNSQGMSCVSGQQCTGGACVCRMSGAGCSGGVNDTCSSILHCGRCGNACEPEQACINGVCVTP